MQKHTFKYLCIQKGRTRNACIRKIFKDVKYKIIFFTVFDFGNGKIFVKLNQKLQILIAINLIIVYNIINNYGGKYGQN